MKESKLHDLPYQAEGVKLIERFNGRVLLADDPGLGKTRQALRWISKYMGPGNVVVVVQANLKVNWAREAWKHVRRRVNILETRTPPKFPARTPKDEIFVINYDILGRPGKSNNTWLNWLKKLKPKCVVLDEVQMCKGRGTIRTKGSRELCRKVPHVLALGGTGGLENCPFDLYPILNILWPEVYNSPFAYAHDHCLPKTAPILMGDLTQKSISEVMIGDKVMGWSFSEGGQRRLHPVLVKNTITKKSPLQTVILQNGDEIVCTPDHKWATGWSRNKESEYREARTGRLGGGGRNCASRVMQIFQGTSPNYKENRDYRLGYIHGFFRGDGHCVRERTTRIHAFKYNRTQWLKNTYKVGVGCLDEEPITRLCEFLTVEGVPNRKFQRGDGLFAIGQLSNKRVHNFISKSSARRNSDEWWAGFLGGIYDAEGSGQCIFQKKEVNPETYAMIQEGLDRFGFDYRINPDMKGFRIRGGRPTLIRFWNIANPILRRKLTAYVLNGGGKFSSGGLADKAHCPFVHTIIPIKGTHTTYTLTTETGNYVAYGYGSKNCAPKKTHWGWEFKGATNLPALHADLRRLGMIRRRKEDVLKDLPAVTRIVTSVELPPKAREEYGKAEKDFVRWLMTKWFAAGKSKTAKMSSHRLAQMTHLKMLAGQLKFDFIREWLTDWLADNPRKKILVFGIHTALLTKLHQGFGNSVLITGKVPQRKRQPLTDKFNTDPACRVFFGNVQAAGAGWSCTSSSTTLMAEFSWNPALMKQAGGRNHGVGRGVKGEPNFEFWLVATGTIEEKLVSVIQRKQGVTDEILDGAAAGSSELNVFDQLTDLLGGR